MKRFTTVAVFLCALLFAGVSAFSQDYLDRKITVKFSYESLSSCLKSLQTKSGIKISFNENEVSRYSVNDNLNFNQEGVESILSSILKNTGLQYKLMSQGIVIFPKTESVNRKKATQKITGFVLSDNDKPLAGASVQVKGSFHGTFTASDGAYSIEVPEDKKILVFSSVGYDSKEAIVSAPQLNVTLKTDDKVLNDVVVVGYGSVKKRDVTGAVSSIKGEEISKMNATNFDAALAGRAPGVYAVKTSGAPGAVASIRVRGGISAIGTNEPLYVIDGIPVELGDGFGADAYAADSRNKISPLSMINPEDIESIDILKDASSAAIYGSRAGNGVVIVTTKRGKKGPKPNITFGSNTSFDRFGKQYEVLNTAQFRDVVKTAYANTNTALPASYIAYPSMPDVSTDWVDLATRTANTNNNYLNINGASNDGSTLYSFSGSITDQNGVIRYTDFNRYNLRTSLETTLFDKLRFGTNINFTQQENNGSGTGQFYLVQRYRPDVPLYDLNGLPGTAPDSVNSNPIERLKQISKINNQAILATIFGEIELLQGFRFRSSISYNFAQGTNIRYTPSTDIFEQKNGRRGSRTDYLYSSMVRVFDNMFTYNRKFNEHDLNMVAGLSFTQTSNDFTNLSSTGFQDDEILNNLGSASSIQTYSSGGNLSGLMSYFLRTNYNYRGKYYATFTGRADKSTKFGPAYRWGFFPSGALAWRISQENFMNQYSFIDDLKLRVSHGKTGSANFPDFIYGTFFVAGSFYAGDNGVISNNIPNPDIRWETAIQTDLAIDYSFLKGKIRGSLGLFKKKTVGLIVQREIIRETGGITQNDNLGNFLNKGIELQVGSDLVRTKNFSYYTDLNITRYKSKVLTLNGGIYSSLREGQPIGYFRGYEVAGIFQTKEEISALNAKSPTGYYQNNKTAPGDFQFKDLNGDGYVSSEDINYMGKAEPDFYGGWNNVMRYKDFELSAFFNFSVGNNIYNSARRDLLFFTTNTNNYSTDLLNAWSTTNMTATLPRLASADPNNNRRDSDFFIEDGSFFKLKNLQVSYTLRNNLLQKVFINSVRLYATASNVFTITKYKGLDPEISTNATNNLSPGIDNNIYPQTKSFVLGATLNF